jgi:hypothetical protein
MSRNNTKMLGITAHFRRQDGKADPPPPKFDRSRYYYNGEQLSRYQLTKIRSVSEGDVDSLLASFTWDHTPQGGPYWHRTYQHTSTLRPEDIDYMEWLLEEYVND